MVDVTSSPVNEGWLAGPEGTAAYPGKNGNDHPDSQGSLSKLALQAYLDDIAAKL
jgi:hypothetical protein